MELLFLELHPHDGGERGEEREQRVEAQVQEVSQIFGRVADLIKDQGESVERIEVNVESAAADVEAAEGELMERLDNMGGNLVIGLKVGGIVLATMVAYVILV